MAKAKFENEKQLEEAKKKAKDVLSYRKTKHGVCVSAKKIARKKRG